MNKGGGREIAGRGRKEQSEQTSPDGTGGRPLAFPPVVPQSLLGRGVWLTVTSCTKAAGGAEGGGPNTWDQICWSLACSKRVMSAFVRGKKHQGVKAKRERNLSPLIWVFWWGFLHLKCSSCVIVHLLLLIFKQFPVYSKGNFTDYKWLFWKAKCEGCETAMTPAKWRMLTSAFKQ